MPTSRDNNPKLIYLYVFIILVLGFHLGFVINNYLTGRRFVKDLLHFRKLNSLSLEALDNQWNVSNHSNITVSLTTIPSRINCIAPTIKSLIYQKRLPKKIILNVPYISFRNSEEYIIPEWLLTLDSLEINRIDQDYGPATKFIPTVESHQDDELILVVDDDHIYPPKYIQEFEKGEEKNSDCILASSGWRVPEDLVDKPTTMISNIMKTPPTPVKGTRIKSLYVTDIIQGYSGYLIKPRFFDIKKLKDFSDAPEIVKYVDDVWISAHSKVSKYVLPLKRYCYSPMPSRKFFRSTSLSMINNRGKERNEDRHNSIAIKYFKDRWECLKSR